MANNINIPFEMQLVAIKNANEISSKLSATIATNLATGIEEGLRKINIDKTSLDNLSEPIVKLDKNFRKIVEGVNILRRTVGDTSPIVKAFGDALPKNAKDAEAAFSQFGRIARSIFARLASDNQTLQRSGEKALKNIFQSDAFTKNKANQIVFLNELTAGLSDYTKTVQAEGRKVLKTRADQEKELARLIEENANFVEQRRVARAKAELSAQVELNNAKIAAERDYREKLRKQRALLEEKAGNEALRDVQARAQSNKLDFDARFELGQAKQKQETQEALELRKQALSFVNRELALNRELLKEKKALRAVGVLDDSAIQAQRNRIDVLEKRKDSLDNARIAKEIGAKPLKEIVDSGKANVDNVTRELDAAVKTLQSRREQVAQTKRLEKATERVVAQQERLRNLLLQTLQLRGNLSGKDKGFDAIQAFVNADPRQIAEDRVNKKSGVLTPEQLKIAADGVKQVNAQARAHHANALSIENFGKASVLAFKRYGAFLTGTFVIYKIQQGFQFATDEALKFEAAMTKVEQVAVRNVKQLGNIANAIRSAAINTGTSLSGIADIVQIFGQAGFKDAKELAKIADSLSKIPLAATFGDLKSTSEGLIAIFGQFNKTLSDTPQILDLVNQFAADFAVESGDIFEGVKRGGAIFAEAGGSLEEFVSLFSLLRSATRQSAETIGTFFKSGISKLLGDDAQRQLKTLGVEAEGAIPQLQELAQVLFNPKFKGNVIREASKLIDNRQVGLLVALLRELEQARLKALQNGGINDVTTALKNTAGSLDRDIVFRLDDVGTSLNRVKQALSDLAVEFIQNTGVKSFVKDMADLTISLSKALKLLVAFLPAASAFSAAIAIPRFVSGIRGFTSGLGGGTVGSAEGLSGAISAGIGGVLGQNETKTQQRTRLVSGLAVAGLIGAGQFLSSKFRNEDGSSKKIAGNFTANNLGTVLNTAGIGALIGGAILPGIGTAVGGVIGAAGGLVVALKENSKAIELAKIRTSSTRQLAEESIIESRRGSRTTNPLKLIGAAVNSPFAPFLPILGPVVAIFGTVSAAFLAVADVTKQVVKPIRTVLTLISYTKPAQEALQLFAKGSKLAADVMQEILNILLPFTTKTTFTSETEDFVKKLDKSPELANKFAPELNEIRKKGIEQTQKFFIEKDTIPTLDDFDTVRQLITEQLLRDSEIFKNFDPTVLFEQLSNFNLDDVSFSKVLNNTVGVLDNFRENFAKSLNDFVISLKLNEKNFASVKDRLGGISTNLDESLKTFLPSDDNQLLKFVGLDTGFDSLNLGQSLQKFFSQPDARAAVNRLRDPVKIGDPQTFDLSSPGSFRSIVDFIFSKSKQSDLISDFSKQFEGVFETLSQINNVPIGEIFKSIFVDSDNLIVGADKAQEKLNSIIAQTADAIRKQAELTQQKIELENALAKSSRDANQALFQLNSEIAKNALESKTRGIDNNLSLNSSQSASLRANLFRQVATTSSFGNTAQFIQSYLDANRKRIDLQQTLTSSRSQLVNREDLLLPSNQADQAFQNSQQELTQRISEFDTRISAAAQATDILKQEFISLRDSIRSAGQSITSLTSKDFGNIVGTLRSFVSGGGLQNPFGPLSKFSSSQFGLLQQGLGLVGNINLGGGQTGNSILEGIQDQLGVAVVAGIKSLFTGQDETANVTKELQESRKKAEDAAKLEDALRQEQLSLLRAQAAIIPDELKFYQDQLGLLGKIDTNLGQLNDIRNSVTKLFTGEAQNVVINKGNGPTNNSTFFGTPLPTNKSIVKTPSVNENAIPPSILQSPNSPFTPRSIRVPNVVPLPRQQTPTEEITGFDSRGRPIIKDSLPNGFAPFVPLPRGTAPPLSFGSDQLNEGVGNLVDAANGIQQTLEKLTESQKMTLEIAPMQVNVALSAPDVLKLVGPQLQASITKQISLKLSEVFQTDPETSSKILASLGT